MVQVLPSALGKVIVNGQGGYRMPSMPGANQGTYSYDSDNGKFQVLTGPLKAPQIANSYSFSRGSYFWKIDYKGQTHTCSFTPKNGTAATARPVIRGKLNGGFAGQLIFALEDAQSLGFFSLTEGKVKNSLRCGYFTVASGTGEIACRNLKADILRPPVDILNQTASVIASIPAGLETSLINGMSLNPSISPDGKLVSVFGNTAIQDKKFPITGLVNKEMVLAVFSRDGKRLVTIPGADPGSDPVFTPGNDLLFSGRDGVLWMYSLRTGQRMQVSREQCAGPAVSADGRQIACIRGQGVWRAGLEGNSLAGPFVAVQQFDTSVASVAWHPNGGALLITAARKYGKGGTMWIVPLDAGAKPVAVTDAEGDPVVAALAGNPHWLK